MKNKSYYEESFILDNIEFSEENDIKSFQIGKKVRIPIKKKMKISGKSVDVTITDFAEVTDVRKDKVVVLYQNKTMRYLMADLIALNEQRRIEFSAWSSFVNRDFTSKWRRK